MVAELDLALDGGEFDGLLFVDWVGAVEDGVAALHVEQVKLNGVARVDVLVGEEELALEDETGGLVDALLAEGFGVVEPSDVVLCVQLLFQLLHLLVVPAQGFVRLAAQRQRALFLLYGQVVNERVFLVVGRDTLGKISAFSSQNWL